MRHQTSKMKTATLTFPDYFDQPTIELINGCLTIDPNERIGCGEGEDFESAFFKLEFFEGIETSTINDQIPPIDEEVVRLINKEISEKSEAKSQKEPKSFHGRVLHNGTAYIGEWMNHKRHGKGMLCKPIGENKF